jgi:carbonic anhydrase
MRTSQTGHGAGGPMSRPRVRAGGGLWIATLLLLAVTPAARATAAGPGTDLCDRGRRQSPIDIESTVRSALPALVAAYRPAPLRVVNDGHTVRLRFSQRAALNAGREALSLHQLHFHLPAGDRVRGEEFPLAIHLLHRSPAGQLVSVVLLFRLGAEHPALAALLPHLPPGGQPEREVPGVTVDPARFLPAALGYYAYDGSLTSAPCTEGVRWLVLKDVQTLSAAQAAALRRLFPPNARPVQPLNGRSVRESP